MSTVANTSLDMNALATATLVLLADTFPEFAPYEEGRSEFSATTAAWYNGRERGFSVVVKSYLNPSLHIEGYRRLVVTCAEHRNVDSVVVDWWLDGKIDINPPTPGDMPGAANWEAAVHRETFCDPRKAADHIYDVIARHYKEDS